MKSRKLSTIELTFLGLTWLRGPCTTYSIMKELSMSASSFHKSRAGTAYSVVKRLTANGFIETLDDQTIRVTQAGIDALQGWFTSPVPLADISHSADLIRLRFFFLGVVDLETRLNFIDSSIKGLHTFRRKCEELLHKNEEIGDYFGVLATLSTILETDARIEWLNTVRKWVENPVSGSQPWAETVLKSLPKQQ